MAAFVDFSCTYSGDNRAALLANVSAVVEAALPDIRLEFAKATCKFLLADNIVTIRLKCRKSRSVSYIAAVRKLVKLRVARGVSAASEFSAYFRRRNIQRRVNGLPQS